MNDEAIVLPLFPTTGVILPYVSMTLIANEEPYIQLIQDCIENDSLFLSAYFNDNGLYDVGCACEILNHEIEENKIIVEIHALRRVYINSIIKFEDGKQIVSRNEKVVVFKSEEPAVELPYQLVNGELFQDSNTNINEDIKNQVYEKFKEFTYTENKKLYQIFIDLLKNDFDEGMSFFILNNIVDDQSEEENSIRYEMLSRKSENKRLRLIGNLLCDNDQNNFE